MRRIDRVAWTGSLLLAYLVALVSAVAALAPLFLVAAVVVVVLELVLSRRAPHLLPESLTSVLGGRFRLLSLDVLTALLAARLLPDAGPIVALAIVAVLLLAGARDVVGVFARRAAWRRAGGPVSWRNLDVRSLPVPTPLAVVREPDAALTLLTLLIPLGYALGSVVDRFGAAIAAQWAVVVLVLVVLGWRGLQYLRLNRRSNDAVRDAVREAIDLLRPEVVLHHSGRRGTVDQVLLWVPALLALDRSCLIVVREQGHLDALDGCGIPAVWAPRSQDVELFMVPSIDLALYPSDSTNINNHLLRVTGVYDVLIGHGDSDEPESRSPVARMYDEVWVAGPAGEARYALPFTGVSAKDLRQIGPVRPALEPVDLLEGALPVVVYAPAWEAPLDAVDLSSLMRSGQQVLDALLARQDVQVVFVPAAATGSRSPDMRDALDRMLALVAAAGFPHRVVGPERLRAVLEAASFAVLDVSPALAEAVRADVPFAVPAVGSLSDDVMRSSFPSVAAGRILRDFPTDVFDALDDALGPDQLAGERLALGRTLDSAGDFTQRFRSAVDDALAVQRRRRAFARPAV